MDITETSWEKIEVGMTEDEVIGILGVPPGVYSGTYYWGGHPSQTTFFHILGTVKKQWTGTEAIIEIGFDEEDKVAWSRLSFHIDQEEPEVARPVKWKARAGTPDPNIPSGAHSGR